jgi:hypothetical protein
MFIISPALNPIECMWSTVKGWVASQNNFCRTEDVRWPCKGKLCGVCVGRGGGLTANVMTCKRTGKGMY